MWEIVTMRTTNWTTVPSRVEGWVGCSTCKSSDESLSRCGNRYAGCNAVTDPPCANRLISEAYKLPHGHLLREDGHMSFPVSYSLV